MDKTEYAHRMRIEGKYYFLSRPRSFGKSLFVDMQRELFECCLSPRIFGCVRFHRSRPDRVFSAELEGLDRCSGRGSLNEVLLELADPEAFQAECERGSATRTTLLELADPEAFQAGHRRGAPASGAAPAVFSRPTTTTISPSLGLSTSEHNLHPRTQPPPPQPSRTKTSPTHYG